MKNNKVHEQPHTHIKMKVNKKISRKNYITKNGNTLRNNST